MDQIPFEKSGGNVFADMGLSAAETEAFTAKSTLILAMKEAIAGRALTQKAAAAVCGTDQPTLSKVLHGRMESVTIDRLACWLTKLGHDVEIVVQAAPGSRVGRLRVREAA